jgi:hypothetical protein
MTRRLTLVDRLICEADTVMRTLTSRGNTAGRPSPAEGHRDADLDEREPPPRRRPDARESHRRGLRPGPLPGTGADRATANGARGNA